MSKLKEDVGFVMAGLIRQLQQEGYTPEAIGELAAIFLRSYLLINYPNY